MHSKVIGLLTDFGHHDAYVGVMKAVIFSQCPKVHIIDISHEVPPFSIAGAAFIMRGVFRFFPRNSIFVCVVDPGVGSSRLPIVLKSQGYYWVGPDNGIFPAILETNKWEDAIVIKTPITKLVSSTFHGRDIFAPVAGQLVKGVPLNRLGFPLKKWAVDTIQTPQPSSSGYKGEILWIDHFGNAITNFTKQHFSNGRKIYVGNKQISIYSYYTAVPIHHLLGIWGSQGYLEISSSRGSASKQLHLKVGQTLFLK